MTADALITTVTTLGGIMTVVAGVAVLKDKPPFKWLLGRLVVEPASEAADRKIDDRIAVVMGPTMRQVEAIFKEVHPNSGTSMRDAIDSTHTLAVEANAKVDMLDGKVDAVSDRTARLEGAVQVLAKKG